MEHGIAPKINLFERMEFSKLDAPGSIKSARLDDVEKPETTEKQSYQWLSINPNYI